MNGKNCGLMPCELEHRQEFRAEREQKQERKSYTRHQWHSMGRRVTAVDKDAVKCFLVKSTGKWLYLFSESQTVQDDD